MSKRFVTAAQRSGENPRVLCTDPVFKDGAYLRCGVCDTCKGVMTVERPSYVWGGPQRALLNESEQTAWNDVVSAMQRIQAWGLATNESELGQAVHVIQGFITQHMLQRIEPDHWGHWYVGAVAQDVGAESPAHESPESESPPGPGDPDREGERTGTDGVFTDAGTALPDRSEQGYWNRSEPMDWRARAYAHAEALVSVLADTAISDEAVKVLEAAQSTIGLDQVIEPRFHGAMANHDDGMGP